MQVSVPWSASTRLHATTAAVVESMLQQDFGEEEISVLSYITYITYLAGECNVPAEVEAPNLTWDKVLYSELDVNDTKGGKRCGAQG